MGGNNQNIINQRGIPIMPALPSFLAFTQGNIYHVKPYSGNDGNTGLHPDSAWKTLAYAQSKCTADQNDIVLLYAESNSASACTDYQTTTLSWSKDGVHLIGISSGNPISTRARIAWASTAASASDIPLMTVDADNCYIANIALFTGINDANLSFGLNVTGDRNRFENVHSVWPGHDTNDAAGGYALKVDGVVDTLFKDCFFGSYTISTGTAANSVVLLDSGLSGVMFENCKFMHRTTNATNTVHIATADNATLGFGCVWFDNCGFIGVPEASTAATAVATITASQADGYIIMNNCYTNLSKWDNTDADMIYIQNSPTPAADTCGVARAV